MTLPSASSETMTTPSELVGITVVVCGIGVDGRDASGVGIIASDGVVTPNATGAETEVGRGGAVPAATAARAANAAADGPAPPP